MSLDPVTQRTVRQLVARLNRVESEVRAQGRASQARNRSFEDGPVTVVDADGVVRSVVGLQADGSFTTVDQNGAPPPVPSEPLVDTSHPGTVVVEWDGMTADEFAWPADFDRVEVHVAVEPGTEPTNENEVASFHSVNGGRIDLALDPVEVFITLTAVNTSEVESGPSVEVTALPLPAPEALPAPTGSPTPTVVGGIDSLRVTWALQPTGTRVEVHVSLVSGFTPSAATLVATTEANGATVVRLPNGAALTYTTAYYVRTIAYTEGGSAPASPQVAASLNPGALELNAGGTTSTTRLIVTSSTDVTNQAGNTPPLVIGPPAGNHMRLDGNEILAMDAPAVLGRLGLQGKFLRAWGFDYVAVNPDEFGNVVVTHGMGTIPVYVGIMPNTEGITWAVRARTDTTFTVGLTNSNGTPRVAALGIGWLGVA